MGDRVDERRHADHPPHVDESRPAEYGRCGRNRQGHQQDSRRPHARPIGQATERNGKDSVVSYADQIGGADRRQQDERECDRLQPGKPAASVLPWPDQLQVVFSVEINSSRSHGRAYCKEAPRSRCPPRDFSAVFLRNGLAELAAPSFRLMLVAQRLPGAHGRPMRDLRLRHSSHLRALQVGPDG